MLQRHAAFTLIELLMSVAIVALLAGIGLPPMGRLVERHRANAAMNTLTAHMQLARIAAISRNRRAVLCPTSDGARCVAGNDWSPGWMMFIDEDGNRQPDHADDILQVDLQAASPHLRITSNSGRAQLRYLPDGTSAGSNLTVSVCTPDGQLLGQVIVNNIGRPRSQRPAVATACPA